MKQDPIYTSRGEWVAMLVNGYFLYNTQGEWIGFLDLEQKVYSVRGEYVGWMSNDHRVLRRRDTDSLFAHRQPPPKQPKLKFPSSVALPPMMAETTWDVMDVLDETPERLDPDDLDRLADID
jgi:hypothetical protein